jgi:hypothetical protein
MEVNIINLLGFTLQNSIFEWAKNFVQNHPNCTFLKSWNRHFASILEQWRMMRRFTCNCKTYNNIPLNVLRFIMNAFWN